MMAVKHFAIATAGTFLILGTASPLPLGLAIVQMIVLILSAHRYKMYLIDTRNAISMRFII